MSGGGDGGLLSPSDGALDGLEDGGLGDLDALLDGDRVDLATTDISAPVFGEEVTSVARQESTVGRSPAAVYMITNEMIRRSGVRSILEALRLAPGVQVARIDASKWAVSIRGFNQRFANKLLVLLDGRSVYTPLFAGVFWDTQDVLLEDIDRIEVIRGPGASVWGPMRSMVSSMSLPRTPVRRRESMLRPVGAASAVSSRLGPEGSQGTLPHQADRTSHAAWSRRLVDSTSTRNQRLLNGVATAVRDLPGVL